MSRPRCRVVLALHVLVAATPRLLRRVCPRVGSSHGIGAGAGQPEAGHVGWVGGLVLLLPLFFFLFIAVPAAVLVLPPVVSADGHHLLWRVL